MLRILQSKCENYEITAIRTSSDTHLHSKDHFHKNPLVSRVFTDF